MNLSEKAQEYKTKVEQLKQEKDELNRQLIIYEEQYKQYKEKIEQAFGTSDPDELQKIAEKFLEEIHVLEKELNESTERY